MTVRTTRFLGASLLCAALLTPWLAHSQPANLIVGNNFVRVVVNSRSGQFAIETTEGLPLSYRGSNEWNSHTVFYLNATGSDVFYTNQVGKETPDRSYFAGLQSVLDLPDSCYVIGDTVRTVWTNMRSFRVVQNLFPTQSIGGGQIVIQYTVQARDENTSNHFKGIYLMVDLAVQPYTTGDNCQRDADKPLVLTSLNYDATPSASVCWNGQEHRYQTSAGIPDWFIAGLRFPDYGPSGSLLGKGILKGPGLTVPNEFYVSDWGSTSTGLKDSAWNFSFVDQRRAYSDAAVGYKWTMDIVGTSAPRVIATSYGMNDHQTSFTICQNNLMMLVSLSPRDHYRNMNGKWDSLTTNVDLYVANVDHLMRATTRDTAIIDVTGSPELVAPSSTRMFPYIPGTTSANLGGGQVGVAHWVLKIDTTKAMANRDFTEDLSFRVTTSNIPDLNASCGSLTSIRLHAYAPDVTPPAIAIVSNTRISRQWEVRDGGAGNSGIDSIVVVANTNYQYLPPSFAACDTTERPQVIVRVVDTTKYARFVFRAVDCSGNTTVDSVLFSPGSPVDEGALPQSAALGVYPNPLRGEGQVLTDGAARSLRIVNSLGADVTDALTPMRMGDGVAHIDASHLAPGIYHVIADVRGVVRRVRFIVVH